MDKKKINLNENKLKKKKCRKLEKHEKKEKN